MSLMRRSLYSAIAVFLADNESLREIGLSMFIWTAVIQHVFVFPYKSRMDNWLELLLMMVAGYIATTTNPDEADGSKILFALIAVCFAMFVFVAYLIYDLFFAIPAPSANRHEEGDGSDDATRTMAA